MRRPEPVFAAAIFLLLTACGNAPPSGDGPQAEGTQTAAVRDLSALKVPVETVGTPAPATEPRQYDVDKLSARETFGVYYGYSGPWYSQLQLATGVSPLEKSVHVLPGAHWSENLLVRNDTLTDIGALRVQATLLDDAGQTLAKATSRVLIDGIRPGEPVPVALSSHVPTGAVASVEYTFKYTKTSPAYRQLTTLGLRSWPYGHDDRSGIPKEIPGDLRNDYLGLVNVTNAGDVSLSGIALWLGWIDANGRLLHVQRAQRIDYGQTREQASRGGDFFVAVSDPVLAKQLIDAQPISWAVGVPS